MKLWNYTALAKHYNKRPGYPEQMIQRVMEIVKFNGGEKVCDVGAGTAYLTDLWAQSGLHVFSTEPNQEMLKIGVQGTKQQQDVVWSYQQAESLSFQDDCFHMVSFGSSFNVVDQNLALQEAYRVARSKGWFFAIWNHRNLEDGFQHKIELCIKEHIAEYQYGSRRIDQQKFLVESSYFSQVVPLEMSFVSRQSKQDILTAWKSHATLKQQAGDSFEAIIEKISDYLSAIPNDQVEVPYTCRAWLAQFKEKSSC